MKRAIATIALVLFGGVAVAAVALQSSRVEAAAEKTGISWEVQPDQVMIYLDEKKLGEAGKVKFTEAKPGKHAVKLMLGKDETETEVVVKKGQTLKFSFSFDQG